MSLFGSLYPNPLTRLSDVTISTPTDCEVLKYNDTSKKWENSTSPGIAGTTVETQIPFGSATANTLSFSSNLSWDGSAVSISGILKFGTNVGEVRGNNSAINITLNESNSGKLRFNSNVEIENKISGSIRTVTSSTIFAVVKDNNEHALNVHHANKNIKVGGDAGNAGSTLSVELASTTQAFRTNKVTTTQRLAITPLAGMSLFDTNVQRHYEGADNAWRRMDGGSLLNILYKAETNSQSAPPGSGAVRWNNATQPSATELFLSATSDDGTDVHELLELLLKDGVTVTLFDRGSVSVRQSFQLTADATDNTTYFTLPVAFVDGTATFANNAKLDIFFNTGTQTASSMSTNITGQLLTSSRIGQSLRVKSPTEFEYALPKITASADFRGNASANTYGSANEKLNAGVLWIAKRTNSTITQATSGKWTYTGSANRDFKVFANISVSNGAASQDYRITIAINESSEAHTRSQRTLAMGEGNMSIMTVVSLTEDDFIEIFIEQLTGNSDTVAISGHLLMESIEDVA